MGTVERHKKEKQARRSAIINAAERLFFSQGYIHTTMDDIAKETQLAKGTLYLYVKSKEELFHAVALRGMEILIAHCNEVVPHQACELDKITAYGHGMVSFAQDHLDYFLLMSSDPEQAILNEDTPTNQRLEQISQRFIEQIASAIDEGKVDGSIDSQIPSMETALILSFSLQSLLRATLPNDPSLQEQFHVGVHNIINVYFDLIRRSLSGPGSKES
jgi:TetR/AcrR family transcriptional regulator